MRVTKKCLAVRHRCTKRFSPTGSIANYIRIAFITSVFVICNPSAASHNSGTQTGLPFEQRSVLRFVYLTGETGDIIRTAYPASDSAIEFSADYTVEVSVFPEQFGSFASVIHKREDTVNPKTYFSLDVGPDGFIYFRHANDDPGTDVTLVSDRKIPDRIWSHIAAVFREGTMDLYLDGQYSGSQLNVAPPSTQAGSAFRIGEGFNGAFAQVRVWDRALTVEEIGANMGEVVAIEPGLLAYWPLDDQTTRSSRDLSSFGRPLLWEVTNENASPRAVSPDDLIRGDITSSTAYGTLFASTTGFPIDFNNDGATDYVRTGLLDHELMTLSPPHWVAPAPKPMTAWRNDGNGNFVDASAEVFTTDIQTVASPNWIVADFNGDDRDDAYILDLGPDPLPEPCPDDWCFPGARGHLLIQTIAGTLEDRSETNLPDVFSFVHSAVAADIDDDGDIDLYIGVAGSDGHQHTCLNAIPIPDGAECTGFYINDGTGRFTQDLTRLPEEFTRGGDPKSSLGATILDIDGDKDVDLIIGRYLLVNDGTGVFTEAGELPTMNAGAPGPVVWGPIGFAHADLNSDGIEDIVIWYQSLDQLFGRIQLFFNQGNGVFQEVTDRLPLSDFKVGNSSGSLILADFDDNGSIDISYTSEEAGRLFLNDGTGAFSLAPPMSDLHFSFAQAVTTADVNRDGRPDWIGDMGSKGFFVSINNANEFSRPPGWVLNDFNGDMHTDLPWRKQSSGQNRLWLMSGPVREHAGSIPAIDPQWTNAGTGDFNKDGKVDIYWRNNVSGINRIWFMDGLTRVGFERTLRMKDTRWQVGAICDLNNDANADIIWRHSALPQTRAWLMNGATQIDRGALPLANHPWFIAGCGDFDGDGNEDILWRNTVNGQNRIWLMNGTTRKDSGSINIANTNFRVGGVGDFTEDGNADILFQNDTTGQSLLWAMDGLTRLWGAALPRQKMAFTGAAIGDYGGDGKLDIFWISTTGGKNQIWNMDAATRMSIDEVAASPAGFTPMP